MQGSNKGLHMVSFILLIVGGLNWLIFGLLGWEIGQLLGGMSAIIPRIIYILVGLAAIYEIATHKDRDKMGAKPMGGTTPPAAGPQQ